MVNQSAFPKTLQACIQHFSDEGRCIELLASMRWPNGPVCPNCSATEGVYYLENQKRWKCRGCKKQFSAKAGTIFEDSPISLTKWFPAMWLICGAKNGISSYEIHRALGVTQKTAWFMLHRIRLAMAEGTFEKMSGEVEADETFVGGSKKNMHAAKRRLLGRAKNSTKAAVMGLLERDGRDGKGSRVRARVIPNREAEVLRKEVRDAVVPGSKLYTDEWVGYKALAGEYEHEFVNHMETYVRGRVSTNGLENFWALLKRSVKGTYVNVEPFHLARYVDEQAFRFNERFGDDADRFLTALRDVVGRRITFDELTGNTGEVKPSVNGGVNVELEPPV